MTTQTTLRPYLLMWWDKDMQKAQNITLMFASGTDAWNWMMTIPGLDTYKKCGAFRR